MRSLFNFNKKVSALGMAFIFAAALGTSTFASAGGAADGQGSIEESYGIGFIESEYCVLVVSDEGTGGCLIPSNLQGMLDSGQVEIGETVEVKFVSLKSKGNNNCCRGHVIIMK